MPSPADLAAAYYQGAAAIRAAVAGLTRDQLLARPVAGKWSSLEVVCHMADFEPVYADRFKRIIALDHPLLMDADEARFAAALGYHDRDVGEELEAIEVVRRNMAGIIRRLKPEQLARTGVHSARGVVTLESLIQAQINHMNHHLPFIAEKRRALGV